MLVRDPHEIDGIRAEIFSHHRHEMPVRAGAIVATASATRRVAGVDQYMTAIGQIDQRRERFAHIIKVDLERFATTTRARHNNANRGARFGG